MNFKLSFLYTLLRSEYVSLDTNNFDDSASLDTYANL